jgi:DNA mismatch endonuclease (patch repair protein)
MVFASRRLVVFVHGCFWHSHDPAQCTLKRAPAPAGEYWAAKLARNIERDCDLRKQLEGLGWRVEIFWECETRDPETLSARFRKLLASLPDALTP